MTVALLAVFAAVGSAVGTSDAALAAPAASTSTATAPATVEVTQAMHITGFNAAVAKAHGFEIRTNAQGQQYAVRIGAPLNASVTPNTPVVTGSCGQSFMYYNAIGHRATAPRFMANYTSGYRVILPTIGGQWVMYFQDRAGIGVITKNGATNGTPAWSNSGTTYHSLSGRSEAWVTTSSWVMLDDGLICTSEGPSDITNLY
jgi:hypothetical protein